MKALILILGIIIVWTIEATADDFVDLVNKGNTAYKEGDYRGALDYYHQAEVERPETPELEYNIGGALYREQKYEEAVERLQKSMATENVGYEAAAHYNLGNVFYRTGDYQNAILSYQKALELNPDDIDAKYNLELARKMLKEQMKPEQQQQQQKPQQQQEQQQEQEQQEQEQPQSQNDEQKQQEQQQQPRPEDKNEMTKEDAERILNALKDDERELQKQQQRFRPSGSYQGNDW